VYFPAYKFKKEVTMYEVSLNKVLKKYQKPDLKRSLWQVANTIVPLLFMWGLMYYSISYSYWLTLLLAIPTGGFATRTFILVHDCGPGSFFRQRWANTVLGSVGGVLVMTPYYGWRHEHAIHHAGAGDLNKRGVGDIWTMTVAEYKAASLWQRICYRAYRNPLIMLGVGPFYTFILSFRFWRKDATKRERASIMKMNIALLSIIGALCYVLGPIEFLMVQLPITWVAGATGIWMFYVQHQFEDVYWERGKNWDYTKAALEGSSYYKLPKILQWFSGNIGFHHIHHLSPKIPNYFLEKCHKENEFLQHVPTITLWSSFKTMTLHLWDEQNRKLVSFRSVKNRQQNA